MPESEQNKNSGTWLWLFAGIAALALGGAVYYWLTLAGAQESDTPQAPAAPLVETATVAPLDQIEIRQTGFVQPRFAVDVSSDVSGRIVTVHDAFNLGAKVAAGTPLISLRRDRFEADLSQAEAAVDQGQAAVAQATASFERQDELAQQNFASQARLDDARVAREQADAQLALALANLRQAQLALDDTVVTAPYDAIVTATAASVGQIISAGTAVGRLVAAEAVEISVGLTPTDIALIGDIYTLIGKEVDVFDADAGNAKLAEGIITKLDPQISAGTRTANVIVEISDPFANPVSGLRLGQLAEVRILIVRDDETLAVPSGAIKTANRVWEVTADQELRAHVVDMLARRMDRAAVNSETLTAGAQVLITDLPAPFEGQKVRIDTQDRNDTDAD